VSSTNYPLVQPDARQLRQRRGDYGFDASLPPLVAMAAGGLALVGLAAAAVRAGRKLLAGFELVGGVALLTTVAFFLHATRRGKFAVWADLLEGVHLRGSERVLDMGCGRGAVLTMAAKLVPRGRVVGLDLWTADQSGNSPAATRRNLVAEGVRERCAVTTGDMTAMPYCDGAFDLITSNLAIHNIDQFSLANDGRLQAIDEAVRVLKPGGRLLIADLMWTAVYAQRLRELGMVDVQQRALGWRSWYAPGMGAVLVTATKPSNVASGPSARALHDAMPASGRIEAGM
jgi:SAM-dependent methyltransferase